MSPFGGRDEGIIRWGNPSNSGSARGNPRKDGAIEAGGSFSKLSAARGVRTGARVVLTADRTLMSSYNSSQFIGFAACFPNVLPKWLYTRLFCPPQHLFNMGTLAAPAGLRKIEAALIESGIPPGDIVIAYPTRIDRVVDSSTKVVAVSTSDPLGMGPASSTFSSLIRREPYTALFFRELMTSQAVTSGRAKVIVGGPGAWQLADDASRRRFRIDCLVEGEGEVVAPKLFKNALEGAPLPPKVLGGSVPRDGIPAIRGPTINGAVEISRGCGRGCEYCSPNMRLVRHLPRERILEEVRVNLEHSSKITLHAEDVLRYKANGMVPDREQVADLFREVARLTDSLGMSHIALSSALAEPRLIEDLAHIFNEAREGSRVYAQTGIETGSADLISKHLRGKAKPYPPERWPEVVEETFKLLSDNNWVVCGTLVMGMPGERAEDVEKTLELVRTLRQFKSLIVPLFFVPLGEMADGEFFGSEAMLPEHWMLLAECVDHDFHWAYDLMDELFTQNRTSGAKARMLKIAAWYMQRRLKPYVEMMREGGNPLEEVLCDDETGPVAPRDRARA
jgi:radical SAM superfamily enzyme YgiQ (UPF0313 family)